MAPIFHFMPVAAGNNTDPALSANQRPTPQPRPPIRARKGVKGERIPNAYALLPNQGNRVLFMVQGV